MGNDRVPDWEIVAFEPDNLGHRDAFRLLNLAWIEEHFFVESEDRKYLYHPEVILETGGQIFMAEDRRSEKDEVLGTCALIVHSDGTFELSKMGVAPQAQRRGIGDALCRAVIEAAREQGAREVVLMSNTILEPAIRLYHRLGFKTVPIEKSDYERANIKMVLEL
jgi:ribosomal protein S18 acetylase RimI-like enzyme